MDISNEIILQFQKKIFSWWKRNKRDFPWRKTKDPYKIMVSEFMLQQTQTNRVKVAYMGFLNRWPTIDLLAKESSSEILKFWSSYKLGYNKRAIWLHEAGKTINSQKSFPKTPEELRKLKGIGLYSSRSIPIFAFNADYATIDTNIRRILITESFATEDMSEKQLLEIAEQLLPKGRSRDWHNALMDYGAIFKTAKKTGIKPKTKQSTFKGSNRQYRGMIIAELTKYSTNGLTKKELQTRCKIPVEKLEHILSSLSNDNLIKEKDNRYYL